MTQLILTSIGVFLAIILVLVVILLVAKRYLVPSGNVTVKVNDSVSYDVIINDIDKTTDDSLDKIAEY